MTAAVPMVRDRRQLLALLRRVLLCAAATAAATSASAGSNGGRANISNKSLTKVHIVAHSHNDPGWLESESQYFQQRTKKIITNVVQSLEADSRRVFHWVEMVYFREWWGEQTLAKQASVRALVKSRQLVFLTGGLCMNDEAIAHQGAVVDQMTWGHRFINQTFGPHALPDVGWQIDAFGHSAGYTALTAAMGMDSRRRDRHFADTPSPSKFNYPPKGEGRCSRMTVSPTAKA